MNPGIRFSVLALALAVTGCGPEEAGPAPTTTAAPKRKAEAPAPVAVAAQVDYAYNPINKRDPFRSFLAENNKGTSNGAETTQQDVACSEPLCMLDTDELTVVAVVSGDANPLAMVEDRNGVGHLVRRNTRIGKQGGKVTQILRDCIVVTSFVTGGADGKPLANKQNMCVKVDQKSIDPLDLLKGKEFSQ